MAAVVPSSPQPPVGASIATARARRRAGARAVILALAAGTALLLLADPHGGPGWLHWGVSAMTMAAACAVLAAGQLSWEHTVASAHAAGLVAGPTTHS
jgi:hypothetical protein